MEGGGSPLRDSSRTTRGGAATDGPPLDQWRHNSSFSDLERRGKSDASDWPHTPLPHSGTLPGQKASLWVRLRKARDTSASGRGRESRDGLEGHTTCLDFELNFGSVASLRQQPQERRTTERAAGPTSGYPIIDIVHLLGDCRAFGWGTGSRGLPVVADAPGRGIFRGEYGEYSEGSGGRGCLVPPPQPFFSPCWRRRPPASSTLLAVLSPHEVVSVATRRRRSACAAASTRCHSGGCRRLPRTSRSHGRSCSRMDDTSAANRGRVDNRGRPLPSRRRDQGRRSMDSTQHASGIWILHRWATWPRAVSR